MASFEDLGLREELLRALEDEDIATPTALQESVIPALRRGGNLVLRASTGSGKTLAYTLGVLDRIEASDVIGERDEADEAALRRPRVLVLVPGSAEAERIALAMIPYAHAVGLEISVPGVPWGTAVADAEVVVAAPTDLMDAIEVSVVKLDTVESVVVDGAAAIAELGQLEPLDSVLDLVPRTAQRVLLSTSFDSRIEDLVERRVKRALRYPPEPAVPGTLAPEPLGTVRYVIAPEREKLDLLASQLGNAEGVEPGPPPIIFCRTDERAAELAERLSIRGFLVGSAGDPDADVAVAATGTTRAELLEETGGVPGQTISYDVPADAATLQARHGGDPEAVVLVEARELAHLREIARQANVRVAPAPLSPVIPRSESDLKAFRSMLRQAIEREDLTAQLLVLEPLLADYPAVEVAAAAAALLRARGEARPAETVAPAPEVTAPRKSIPAGPPPVTWARLFVGVGSRDDVRPADLVGALAGEADIAGSQIGKIDIRDSFSIVEVEAAVADRVIRAVNGTTIKGRSVRVDYDRGGPGRRPAPRGAPRRTTRRPPQG